MTPSRLGLFDDDVMSVLSYDNISNGNIAGVQIGRRAWETRTANDARSGTGLHQCRHSTAFHPSLFPVFCELDRRLGSIPQSRDRGNSMSNDVHGTDSCILMTMIAGLDVEFHGS
jgi:hypothetical protein